MVARPCSPSRRRVPSLLANRSRTPAGRPDERHAVRGHDLGEALVLGEEPVARVDGVAAGDQRRRDDGRCREVGALGVRGADADGLVREEDRERVAVGLAVGDDGLDPEGATGAQDPERDLAAIGDEDLAEHRSAVPGRRERQLDDDELLSVLDGIPGLREARADDARRPVPRPPGRCRACRRRRGGRPPGPRSPAGPPGAGWKIPTAGDVATTRRLSAPACPSRPSRPSRPGPTGVSPDPACDACPPAPRPARSAGRLLSGGRRGGSAEPHLPGVLADLELPEPGGGQLDDEGGEQLGGEAVDGGVVGRSFRGAAGGPARVRLVSSRARATPPPERAARRVTTTARNRSPPDVPGPAGRAGDPRGHDRPAGRSRAVPPQCRTPGPGSVGTAAR